MIKGIRTIGILIPLLLIPLWSTGLPQIMRIGLFYGEKVQDLDLRIEKGKYRVFIDGQALEVIGPGERVSFHHEGGRKMRSEGLQGGSSPFRKLRLERLTPKGNFELRKTRPYRTRNLYPGELTVKAKEERIQFINRVRMADYLAGVVLAEAGQGHHPEFYKVQAVICRTYALHNLEKFEEKGYHLCDKVACQVYEGVSKVEPKIDTAVEATEGIVIVNEEIQLITAAYHSNSGGRTAPSEIPWSKALPYLRPVEDPFSKGGRHYRWKKILPQNEWLAYLERSFDYPVDDPWHREYATSYCPRDRQVHFLGDSIPLQKIRHDLGLKSTFFSIRNEGDTVIFEGKGFGHGVGLSQEGAMRMAELGVPYDEIIHYYYQGVHLVKIDALDFFRDS